MTCTSCGFTSTVFDPFWDLSIPLAQVSSAPGAGAAFWATAKASDS